MFTEHDTKNCETAFVNWLLAVLPTVRFGLAAIHGLVWRRPIFGLAMHKFIDLKSLILLPIYLVYISAKNWLAT